MSKSWEIIAQCLRAELAEYGGLLHLFEAQQRCLCGRDPESVLGFARQIEAQSRSVAECRTRRERIVADFAQENNRPASSSLRTMLTLIEPDARPLLEALISEVDLLLHRVRRMSQHNHSLLSHAAEVHHEALQHLRSQSFTRAYSSATRLAAAAAHPLVRLRMAG
jgi:hypothetical protein